MQRWLPIAAVVVLVLLGLSLRAERTAEEAFGDAYRKFRAIEVGMTEQEVRDLLGDPHEAYEALSAPRNYYLPGHSHPNRPITNKVMIYVANEPIAYIFLGNDDRVEEVFVGGS